MNIISILYKTFLEALFPLSQAESEILHLSPEEAYSKLPPAPGYEGLAIPLPDSHSIFAYKDERVAKLVWNIKYKKSGHAVKIGGYALWQVLFVASMKRKVSRDTPSNSAEFAASSRLDKTHESADSPSQPPKCPFQRCDLNPSDLKVSPLKGTLLIIPMPITNRRRKERGYNQCELLVDEIARLTTETRSQTENNLLIRTHHTSRQTLKGRSDRLESAKGIFEVNEEVVRQLETRGLSRVGLNIIVIDDVITTGSTMFEAIETLKKTGFKNVSGLSLAH